MGNAAPAWILNTARGLAGRRRMRETQMVVPSSGPGHPVEVTLYSNISHSIHAATALNDAGMLDRYFSPLLVSDKGPLVRFLPHLGRRLGERVVSARLVKKAHRMIAGDVVERLGLMLPGVPAGLACAAGLSLNAVIARKNLRTPTILHHHNPMGVPLAESVKRLGGRIVCDERGLHAAEASRLWREAQGQPEEQPMTWRDLKALEGYARADHVIVASEFVRQQFIRRGSAPQKVTVIPLGVDIAHFSPATTPRTRNGEQEFRLLFVGRVGRAKGVDILSEALAECPASVQLTVAGPNDPLGASRKLGDTGRASFLGILNTNELLKEYRRAHLLVLPSRLDSFGLVGLEAMACGVPVIVTDHCGIAEIVRGPEGRVVRTGDVEDLRSAILEYANLSPTKWAEASVAARARACEYSWEAYGERLTGFYSRFNDLAVGSFER